MLWYGTTFQERGGASVRSQQTSNRSQETVASRDRRSVLYLHSDVTVDWAHRPSTWQENGQITLYSLPKEQHFLFLFPRTIYLLHQILSSDCSRLAFLLTVYCTFSPSQTIFFLRAAASDATTRLLLTLQQHCIATTAVLSDVSSPSK